ncbi:MAG TPA: NAD(P)H-hydrate dehydratase [Burkholderiales bacterium]|nr:NAD(P)H-hydrate dehydratase [Burkholderiales bacterium]
MPAALPALYLTSGVRALEIAALKQDPLANLMERAGLAAAELARDLAGERGRSVLVLAGPGNNGGDAFEVATHLKRWFYRVDVVFAGDAAKLPHDAGQALAKWNAVDGRLLQAIPAGGRYDLVVDGLFGIGLTRAIAGAAAGLIDAANASPGRKLALDIASGVNADTGSAPGAAFRATHTITFIVRKPGLYTLDGPDCCGEITLAPLGVDAAALRAPDGHLVTDALLAAPLVARPRNFHKGLAGSLGIVGGAAGMVGAALLAGRAAIRLGAGKVFLGLLTDQSPYVDYAQPELMLRKPDQLLADVALTAIAAGPGMGTDTAAQRLLAQALRLDVPIVLDADALNLVATYSVLQSAIAVRKHATLLTPHPAECARLLGVATKDVQVDRLGAARRVATTLKSHVALKGNGTVIAAPDGRWWINASGNAGMASAGMGDVLTGLVGALAAQGLAPERALVAGVYLHGAAADALVARGVGPVGLTAGELTDAARALANGAGRAA